MATAEFGGVRAGLRLLDNANDLGLGEPGLPHLGDSFAASPAGIRPSHWDTIRVSGQWRNGASRFSKTILDCNFLKCWVARRVSRRRKSRRSPAFPALDERDCSNGPSLHDCASNPLLHDRPLLLLHSLLRDRREALF
jgi:hypothetical protein